MNIKTKRCNKTEFAVFYFIKSLFENDLDIEKENHAINGFFLVF